MVEYDCIDELWSIILCASDDTIANDATRFLLDLYYYKQPIRARRGTAQSLYECFLREVYMRLSALLNSAIPPSEKLTANEEKYYQSLKIAAEQLFNTDELPKSNPSSIKTDHQLWLRKIERLLMITEEYIYLVDHEYPLTAHITSFYALEYQIKIVLGELGKTNCPYDIAVVHANDTLEMLRVRLGLFYKVAAQDVHISIQNTRPLPQSYDHSSNINSAIALPAPGNNTSSSSTSSSSNYSPPSPSNTTVLPIPLNSKYLYQVHITPGSTVYIKILGSSYNQPVKNNNSEPIRLYLNRSSPTVDNTNLTHTTPSNLMAENPKVYDVLYKLSYLKNENIHHRIRNLLRLMPSDIRVTDCLDFISIGATTNPRSTERRASTETPIYQQMNPREAIEHVFNFDQCSLIRILYNLEILSSRISPLSTNRIIKDSSRSFRKHFIENINVDYLFKLLQSLNGFIRDEYEYSLCQEMTILILQLIQLLLCGSNNQQEENNNISRPSSPMAVTANDSPENTIDFDFQPTVEYSTFEEFVSQTKQLIFLCWAAAAGNIRLHEQSLTIREQVKLDRHALLQQINANVFCRNSSKNSSSSDSSVNNHVQKTVQFGACVKKESILPLDGEIAEKIIEVIMICFEKRPEFIGEFKRSLFFYLQTFHWIF